MNIITDLKNRGFVFIKNQSREEISFIMEKLGKIINTTDVEIKSESKKLVTSSRAMDFHTDHQKAKWCVLHCIEQTDVGGESLIIDALRIFHKVSDSDKRVLSTIMVRCHEIFDGDPSFYPLVKQISSGYEFYYAPWLVKKDLSDAQKGALKSFSNAIAESIPLEVKLQKNDAIIMNNRRMLHGRRAITGVRSRLLKRFLIN